MPATCGGRRNCDHAWTVEPGGNLTRRYPISRRGLPRDAGHLRRPANAASPPLRSPRRPRRHAELPVAIDPPRMPATCGGRRNCERAPAVEPGGDAPPPRSTASDTRAAKLPEAAKTRQNKPFGSNVRAWSGKLSNGSKMGFCGSEIENLVKNPFFGQKWDFG